MLLGDVVDQLHHVHGLAHAGTAEEANLAALRKRADQVDNLDAGFEQFRSTATARRTSAPSGECRASRRVNRPASSIGRPSTSMMRPSVGLPTGTLIDLPVFFTIVPRRSPSDAPRQIVRTTPSPSCC